MTPAIKAVERAGIPFKVHSYAHDPTTSSYGQEAADALGVPAEQVFKTLIAQLPDQRLVVAIVPVSTTLDLKALAAACGAKKAAMAARADAERSTGYVLGGISPLGQRKRLPTVLDASALALSSIHVSAGRRGLEIELAPQDLLQLCRAQTAVIAKR